MKESTMQRDCLPASNHMKALEIGMVFFNFTSNPLWRVPKTMKPFIAAWIA
jgi:hypothetical protein